MILKEIDDKTKEIKTLEKLIKESSSEKQKILIKKDLTTLKNGFEAEKDNSYLINFYLKDAKNTIVLHDIRLEHNNLTAQIDHILINKVEIVVVESKSFSGILDIKPDGSFEVDYNGKIRTFNNPIEQNKRHAELLKQFLNDHNLLKNKIGQEISIKNQVILNPKTTIKNTILPNGIIRADQFISDWRNKLNDVSIFQITKALLSMKSQEIITDIANILIQNHKPINFNYEKKYKISKNTEIKEEIQISQESSKEKNIESIKQELKEFRLKKAKEKNFKPYMIFSDKTLEELLSNLPKDKKELKQINGFGDVKIEEFGEEIIKIIN
jgi:superfamily II DNA helicase RecQ